MNALSQWEVFATSRHFLIVGEVDRVIAAFGGIILILSFLFSPLLRRLLSSRCFVFLGGISFPLYLLHGIFIRLPLQWATINILPLVDSDALEYYTDSLEEESAALVCKTLRCQMAGTLLYMCWLALLLVACMVWKTHVDVLGVKFSRWAEDVVMGEKKVKGSALPFRIYNLRWRRWLSLERRDIRSDTEKTP